MGSEILGAIIACLVHIGPDEYRQIVGEVVAVGEPRIGQTIGKQIILHDHNKFYISSALDCTKRGERLE